MALEPELISLIYPIYNDSFGKIVRLVDGGDFTINMEFITSIEDRLTPAEINSLLNEMAKVTKLVSYIKDIIEETRKNMSEELLNIYE